MSQEQQRSYVRMDEESHDVRELTTYEYIFVKFVRPGLAEFIGLLLFLFVDVMAVYSTHSILAQAFAHGISIFFLVTIFAPISGGHLNPAVSLGAFIAGKMTWPYLIFYPIVQLLGGFIGALLALLMESGVTRKTISVTGSLYSVDMAGHVPAPGVGPFRAMLGECIITFMLVLVVLMTTDKKYKTGFAPLSIGFAVLAGVLSCGRIFGGSMNPARSLASAVVSAIVGKMAPIECVYIYFVGPLVGGLLAGLAYRLCFANADSRWVVKKTD